MNHYEIRLKRARERLEKYYEAEAQILEGAQSYTIGSKSLSRADLDDIYEMISKLEGQVRSLENLAMGRKPRKAVGVVPRNW